MLESKKQLRQKLFNLYLQDDTTVYSEILQENNSLIFAQLLILIKSLLHTVKNNAVIGLYWPLKYEPDVLKLIFTLIESNKNSKEILISPKFALPKIINQNMVFVNYSVECNLQKSDFNSKMGDIFHPQNNLELVPNILIIPGVAFSLSGYRLGLGKGHYDKYLAQHSKSFNITSIGVCFHNNLIEYIPFEPHDYRMNYIVTDKILLKL